MNTKHYLIISGIVGGVIGSLLTALLVSPVTAERDKFGVIECSELRVIDSDGNVVVKLGRDSVIDLIKRTELGIGGSVEVYTPNGDVAVKLASASIVTRSTDTESMMLETLGVGGTVTVYRNNKELQASLRVDDRGGRFDTFAYSTYKYKYNNKDVRVPVTTVSLYSDEDGGCVQTHSNDLKPGAKFRVNEHGGEVNVYRIDGKVAASLGVNEHGGRVQVNGKGEGTAAIGINEYGNGAVSTWDKNGYRQ